MRREPTHAEARLWKALRKLETAGSHFRRQVPLGPYVADFACHAARLIIEVDGGIHTLPDVELRDAARNARLTADGWRILRFTNKAVSDDFDPVVRAIEHAL